MKLKITQIRLVGELKFLTFVELVHWYIIVEIPKHRCLFCEFMNVAIRSPSSFFLNINY